MNESDLSPRRSMVGSASRLWSMSPVWKLLLLGATVLTGLYLLDPPWDWKAADSASASRVAQAQMVRGGGSGTRAMPPRRPMAGTGKAPPILAQVPAAPTPVDPRVAAKPALPNTPSALSAAQPTPAFPQAQVVPTQAHGFDHPSRQRISGRIALADQNCGAGGPMRVALMPAPAIAGMVVGFVPEAQAMAMISRSEDGANGRIDPAYIQNLRALFHPDRAPPGVRIPVLVPDGMSVQIGEEVEMVGGHASPDLACHYIPNLIVDVGRVPRRGVDPQPG